MIKHLTVIALMTMSTTGVSAQSVAAPADGAGIGIAPPASDTASDGSRRRRCLSRRNESDADTSSKRSRRRLCGFYFFGAGSGLAGAGSGVAGASAGVLGTSTLVTGGLVAGAVSAAAFGLVSAGSNNGGTPVSP